MTFSDIDRMQQGCINLGRIATAHAEAEAEDVMLGLVQLDEAISRSMLLLRNELSGARSGAPMLAAMEPVLPLALAYGAEALTEVGRRTFTSLGGSSEGAIGPEQAADVLAWLTVGAQTQVALRVLFAYSLANGRAPNGKSIEADPADAPFPGITDA